MPTGTAGGENDPIDLAQLSDIEIESAELGGGFFIIESAAHGVLDGLGLLEDFLEHVMLEITEFDFGGDFFEHLNRRGLDAVVPVVELDAVGSQDGEFVIGEVDDLFGPSGEGTGIAGEEVFSIADADHQRRTEPDGNNGVGDIAEEDSEAVTSLEESRGIDDGFDGGLNGSGIRSAADQLFQLLGDQVGDDLGICRGTEDITERLEVVAEGRIVLDDAVMDDDDFAVATDMGVGVDIVGFAVRGPAGVADAGRTLQRLLFDEALEFANATGLLAGGDFSTRLDSDAGAVVAPIFESMESVQKNSRSFPMTDITDDSTHGDPPLWMDETEQNR